MVSRRNGRCSLLSWISRGKQGSGSKRCLELFSQWVLEMKHSKRQTYFWRWWRITGRKECAGRFQQAEYFYIRKQSKTAGTSKPAVFFCFHGQRCCRVQSSEFSVRCSVFSVQSSVFSVQMLEVRRQKSGIRRQIIRHPLSVVCFQSLCSMPYNLEP